MAVYLTGDKGAITYAGSDGPVVADVFEWTMQENRQVFNTTPFGFYGKKKTMGPFDARGTFKQFVSGTTPPVPGGAGAAPTAAQTLVLFVKNSTQKYTLNVYIELMALGANSSSAEPQVATYQWVFAGDASTDTITAT